MTTGCPSFDSLTRWKTAGRGFLSDAIRHIPQPNQRPQRATADVTSRLAPAVDAQVHRHGGHTGVRLHPAMADQDSAVEGGQSNAVTSVDLLPACRRGRTVHPPAPRAPTARAMTRREVTNAAVACTPIRIFARLVNGIVSVGLNALEFVVDTYK